MASDRPRVGDFVPPFTALERPSDIWKVGIRSPMPPGVRVSMDGHIDPCLLITYTRANDQELIATLLATVDAIRRGPRP